MKANPQEGKKETLERLFKENGLLPDEDWFISSKYKIITRSGIEKIQYKNGIVIRFEAVMMRPEFCVVKARAQRSVLTGESDSNGVKTGKLIEIETFGSAGHNANGVFQKGKDNQYLYYPELAEKRALSRAVLKSMGFYELGVFGEDESEDFKRENATTPVEPPVVAMTEQQRGMINLVLTFCDVDTDEENRIKAKMDKFTYEAAEKTVNHLVKKYGQLIKQAA